MTDLLQKRCVPCDPPSALTGGGENNDIQPLDREVAKGLLAEVPGWELAPDRKHITRTWRFKDFGGAMQFANEVATLAEAEGHHPDMRISYGKVRLELTTHAIGGLTENDFILAAKINELER